MSNKKRRGLAFLLGAAAGATITYFLTTEEGKKWRKETIKRTREFSRRVSDQAQEQLDYIARSMETFVENRQEQAEDIVEKGSEKIAETSEKMESSFQRGMRKAKHRMEQ
ncbi:MAG: YtxH domain-containing protein [Bacteroidota bacterium]